MFRLARLLILLGLGFYLGFNYKDGQIDRRCTADGGTWTGTHCSK